MGRLFFCIALLVFAQVHYQNSEAVLREMSIEDTTLSATESGFVILI